MRGVLHPPHPRTFFVITEFVLQDKTPPGKCLLAGGLCILRGLDCSGKSADQVSIELPVIRLDKLKEIPVILFKDLCT